MKHTKPLSQSQIELVKAANLIKQAAFQQAFNELQVRMAVIAAECGVPDGVQFSVGEEPAGVSVLEWETPDPVTETPATLTLVTDEPKPLVISEANVATQ